MSDVKGALAETNGGKSTGPDYFSVKMIRTMAFETKILDCVSDWLNNACFPGYLKECSVFMLTKTKSTCETLDNARNINLSHQLMKVSEKAWIDKAKELGMFNIGSYQTGFTEGDNTWLNTGLVLNMITAEMQNKRSQKILCSVDTRKAYDTVNREILFQFLNEDAQKSSVKEE